MGLKSRRIQHENHCRHGKILVIQTKEEQHMGVPAMFEFYEQGTLALFFDGGFLLSNIMVAGLVSGALLVLHGSLSKGSD